MPEHYTPGSSTLTITAEIDKNRWARELPLSPRAQAVLAGIAPKRGGRIFPRTPKGNAKRYIEDFKAAVEACGLPKETAPYDLRHACGTHGVEASGGNLTGVAYLLGHKQVTTTNRYVHSNQRAAESVLASIDRSRIVAAGSGCTSPEETPKPPTAPTTKAKSSEKVRRKGLESLPNTACTEIPGVSRVAAPSSADAIAASSGAKPATARVAVHQVAQPTDADALTLQIAIDRLTRALATAADDDIAELVSERRAMREELRAIRQSVAGVVVLAHRRPAE